MTRGTARAGAGDDRGLDELREAAAMAAERGMPAAELRALNNLSWLSVPDDPRAAVQSARRARELARRVGAYDMAVQLANVGATAAIDTGDWQAARKEFDEVLSGDFRRRLPDRRGGWPNRHRRAGRRARSGALAGTGRTGAARRRPTAARHDRVLARADRFRQRGLRRRPRRRPGEWRARWSGWTNSTHSRWPAGRLCGQVTSAMLASPSTVWTVHRCTVARPRPWA